MQKKTITNIVAVISFILTGLFFSLNHSSSVSAYSLTVSTSGSVTANVMPSADGGIGTTVVTDNVNIISNCRAGYTMTIAGPSDNNLYLNGDSTNNTSGTYFSPVNGTSALNNSANANKWGYSLTANSGTGVFSALSSTPTTLKTPSQTASPDSDIDTTIPVYYGTAVNTSMAPGSYTFSNSNSITYSVVMDTSCTSYSVQYQDNGADNPNGMGTTDSSSGEKSVHQINIAEDTKITLLAPNFKKTGYAFLGWSTDSQAYAHFTDNDNTNDPIIYGPMEDVIIDADIMATANTRNQINMYAVWIPALKDGSNNPVYMQEWDNPNTTLPHDGCSTLTATVFDDTVTDEKGKITATKNSVVALTDKRDNMVYAVARLADGNCWMMENLRIESDGTVGNNTNDATITNQSLAQGYADVETLGFGKFVGLASPETAFNSTTANSLYSVDGANGTVSIGTGNAEYRFPRYDNENTHVLDGFNCVIDYNPLATTNTCRSKNYYIYGNYYTWAAVMANTNSYSSASDSESAGSSLCPVNWHLPSSQGATKEFGVLSQSYGGTGNNQEDVANSGDVMSSRFRTFPNNYVYSGQFFDWHSNGRPDYSFRGSNGYYLSRSAYSAGNYYLYLQSERLGPSSYSGSRTHGESARCLVGSSEVSVTLDSNNGTGYIAHLYGEPGSSVTLPNATFSKFGHALTSWNTASDGSGTSYTTSFTIPVGSVGEILYAQWTPQYTITYVNNCMSWASSDTNCTQAKSDGISKQKINLDSSGNGSGTLGAFNKFSLTGWKIKEWTTNADGSGTTYSVSSTYSVTGANAGDNIMLYAHWVPVYSVQYDGNGSDNDGTGMGSTASSTGLKSVRHTNVGEGDTFDLFASNFKKAGYGFIGWSTDANAWSKLTDNDTTNDVRIWGPNEMIMAPAYNGTPITTLYAVWVPAKTSGGNPVYLQGWTGCSAMTATTYNSSTGTLAVAKDSITALTDQRDGQVYAIARLVDGNCWMIENLRLDNTSELTTANTNIPVNNTTLPITNIYNDDPLLATKSNYLSTPSTQSITDDPDYGWCKTDTTACNYQSRLRTDNVTANATPGIIHNITSANSHSNMSGPIYSYGNYYNYYSASAGYVSQGGISMDGDICPNGWKMPASFDNFRSQNGSSDSNIVASNRLRSFPNNFVYSGAASGDQVSMRGALGPYWSSTRSGSSVSARGLFIRQTSVYGSSGQSVSSLFNGNPIRCIASLVP